MDPNSGTFRYLNSFATSQDVSSVEDSLTRLPSECTLSVRFSYLDKSSRSGELNSQVAAGQWFEMRFWTAELLLKNAVAYQKRKEHERFRMYFRNLGSCEYRRFVFLVGFQPTQDQDGTPTVLWQTSHKLHSAVLAMARTGDDLKGLDNKVAVKEFKLPG